MMAFITGNLMAAFVIPLLSEQFFYILAVGINFFCIIYYLFIRDPLPHIHEEDEGSEIADHAEGIPHVTTEFINSADVTAG